MAEDAAFAPFNVLVVDSEGYTAALLCSHLEERGHRSMACEAVPPLVDVVLRESAFDAVVVDHHLARPDELALCEAVKAHDPTLPVVVITSPGPALRSLEAWNAHRRCIDQVIRKPLAGDTLVRSLEALAGERRARNRAGVYAGLIAEEGLRSANARETRPTLAEAAILFTDIRRSTELAAIAPLREWFEAINRSLSDQSARVRANGGTVVKYTGDGLMASFRGRGRAHFALRCATGLLDLERTAEWRGQLRIGVGLAEGLVVAGFIGEPGRQQYDVIGATVHLAARLCGIAAEGEAVATPRLARAAGLLESVPHASRTVNLRGFEQPIECVSFRQ